MVKPTGAEFAAQGVKYIGTPYTELDCQAFVEKMLADAGVKKNWKGSNAMYRDMQWVGSVDACVARFGRVPVGALLFIHEMDGGEEARGYHDGLGNASHVGVYTGVGLGAIHSSSSRGCVAESKFSGKAISGGWNKVGLLHEVNYGIDNNESEAETMNEATAIITAANGKPVNFRKQPRMGSATYGSLPVGTKVEVVETEGQWTRVRYGGNTGYIMSKFLSFAPDVADSGDGNQTPPAGVAALAERVTELLVHVTNLAERVTALEAWVESTDAPVTEDGPEAPAESEET